MAVALTGLMVIAGCESGGDDILAVDATGAVAGLVWVDRNGNAQLDASDGPVRDARVNLIPRSGGAVAYTGETGPSGEFLIPDVLVGDYRAQLDSASIGDTLRILRVDSASLTVSAGDTAVVLAGLTYPVLPIDSVRSQPTEMRVFVEGLVLTRWQTYGEASLHVRDSTGAIRAIRVQPTSVIPGDSVRILGITTVQTGQAVLKDAVTYLLRTGVESPPPDTVTTAIAATAADGRLAADLIHLDSAVVQDTSRNAAGEFVFTVDDGSGSVDVVLDREIQFFLSFENEIIGSVLRVTGILTPSSATGPWIVKPRSSADIEIR